MPQLEQQVKDLTAKLVNIDNSWNQRTSEMQNKVANSDSVINGLKDENQKLKNELIVAQKKVSAANVQLDDKQCTIIMQWFMYGAAPQEKRPLDELSLLPRDSVSSRMASFDDLFVMPAIWPLCATIEQQAC